MYEMYPCTHSVNLASDMSYCKQMNSCYLVVMALLLAKPSCLLTVISDITNMSVHIHFSFATFQNDHIRKVISDACAFFHCQFLEVSWMGCLHRRRRRGGRDSVGFQGSPGRAAAACVLLSAAGSAVVLQRDFGKSLPSEVNWERLPVPALTDTQHSQTFSLFHFISGFSTGPLPRSNKTGVAWWE